ncbi:MAG: pyruvate:ferredoxin (flavodoxin) oxidoreductase, partial [Proteobacteria bacterium]|nr:pyruvate:ferredoxin (flavodoxin) oxidoreductase [Pseudomonadota bacterium]
MVDTTAMMDGNEAVAHMAHLLSEVVVIYPITPASPMGEHADDWSARGRRNIWGSVPQVVEMQSEAGAAGALHGALQAGSIATTFTASQGLLLMLPNMYKIAGELTPTVIHVAARSVASHALSIFGDHSDVMAARTTGFAMLCSNSVQEALDFAFIATEASLRGRVPVLHFFDGFRTSHEIAKVSIPDAELLKSLMDTQALASVRDRALSPEHPVLRGSAQNPDVFFQSREAINPIYSSFPKVVQQVMNEYAEATGRQYRLYDYAGAEDAEEVLVMMGSGAETAEETLTAMNTAGRKTGLLKVRLFRPWCGDLMLERLPDTVRSITVLDRTKEAGADGEPLFKDVATSLAMRPGDVRVAISGGRYGLSSKEFTPGMVASVMANASQSRPAHPFTIGIRDDVSGLSLDFVSDFRSGANTRNFQALFYGLGSDGTVSANKNTIRIIGETTTLFAQGYFVYDSKKSGAVTISHLRFGPESIRSAYLIEDDEADFIACHQSVFLERYDMLAKAGQGATFLLNSETPAADLWDTLPESYQRQIIARQVQVYVIDAYAVARDSGLGRRINTIMQTCFFAITDVVPGDRAVDAIKAAVLATYGRKSRRIASLNVDAIDAALAHLHRVDTGASINHRESTGGKIPDSAPAFVREVTGQMLAGRGDLIPVSQLPVDGTWPLDTSRYEKRNLALEIPIWETDLCTHCGKCVFVCPHSAIRSKLFDHALLDGAPGGFRSIQVKGRDYPQGAHIAYQVAPEDCTGCSLCVDICPIQDKSNVSRKALNMRPQPAIRDREAAYWAFFESLSDYPLTETKTGTMKGAMLLEPHFEFSGACVGCGET